MLPENFPNTSRGHDVEEGCPVGYPLILFHTLQILHTQTRTKKTPLQCTYETTLNKIIINNLVMLWLVTPVIFDL